ncbi:hypothetical protein ACA910_015254 [Epithemia clementina (nom. ined.)]
MQKGPSNQKPIKPKLMVRPRSYGTTKAREDAVAAAAEEDQWWPWPPVPAPNSCDKTSPTPCIAASVMALVSNGRLSKDFK